MALKEVKRSTEDAYTGRGPLPPYGVIIHMQCSKSGASPVNHIYYVHLRWGYVYRVWGVWLCLEYVLVLEVNTLKCLY